VSSVERLLRGSKCIKKAIIWDLEKLPLQRGLLYCVTILKSPLSEVLLYFSSYDVRSHARMYLSKSTNSSL